MSATAVIDLNVDAGEGPGEDALYPLVSSVSVACGGHAGDAASMRAAVLDAKRHAVSVGAHPSYPDRAGFGRRPLEMPGDELVRSLRGQVCELAGIAGSVGVPLRHLKPHGALYNDAARSGPIAAAIAEAADPHLLLVGLAGSVMLDVWRRLGRAVAAEGFADRTYEPDGTLRPRSRPGALIVDPGQAAAQALRLARGGAVQTLCVHADTPGASAILAAVRAALERAGFAIRAL